MSRSSKEGRVTFGKPLRVEAPDPGAINKAARRKPGFKVNPPGAENKNERSAALRKKMYRRDM